MNTDDLRADLRAAITHRDEARDAFAAASDAARRGADLLAQAEEALAEFADLDAKIAIACGDPLARWIAAGSIGQPPSEDLPDALVAAKHERDRAEERANSARAASISLDIDKFRAQTALRDVEQRVSDLAASILQAEVEELAAEFAVAQRVAWVLRARLGGFRAVWRSTAPGTPPSPIQTPDAVIAALTLEQEQQPGGVPKPEVWNTQLWVEYLQRLSVDPDAQFEPRDPQPIVLRPQPAGTVLFRAQGDIEAERLAERQREEAEAHANAPIPGIAAGAIELADLRRRNAG